MSDPLKDINNELNELDWDPPLRRTMKPAADEVYRAPLDAPFAAGALLWLKQECEAQHARAEKLSTQLAATHAAIRALRDEFQDSALVAGQYSVECHLECQSEHAAVAETLTECAAKLARLLGDPAQEQP